MNDFRTVGIIGAGSWGTALAEVVAPRARRVWLWGRDSGRMEDIRRTRRNVPYLPDLELAAAIEPTSDLREAAQADVLLLVMPSAGFRAAATALAGSGVPASSPLISCTKGIERTTGARMSEILADLLPQNPIGVLSGPSHAEEVALHRPTALVLGCTVSELAEPLQHLVNSPFFRTYTSDDVAGIELGGALKNIFAIAAGVCDGLGLGDNSKAALVTRALAELTRIGMELGGQRETFSGLSGIGDLMVTCFSRHSRNRHVGEMLGQGRGLEEIQAGMKMVAEGVPTTRSVYELVQERSLRAPIVEQVHALIYEDQSPRDAMSELLGRDPRPEMD